MVELEDVARASVRGGFYLLLGKISSIILLTINTITIGRLLGPEDYGLFAVSFIIPTFLITLCDLGISASITRYSSYYSSQGKERQASRLIKVGMLIKTISVIVISILFVIFSEYISIHVLNRPGVEPFLRVASIFLIGQAILHTIHAAFIGLDELGKSSILLNVQSFITLVTSVFLIIQGKGVLGAVLGQCFGAFISVIIGIMMFFKISIPKLEKVNLHNEEVLFTQVIKTIIYYGSPLYFSGVTMSLKQQIQNIFLVNYCSDIEIGNYKTATNFSLFIIMLTSTISSILFPAFSKLNIKENKESLNLMFKSSVKYVSLILIPASIAIMIFSNNLVRVLYGQQYMIAPTYLVLNMLIYLRVGLGGFIINIFFSSQARTEMTFKISLFNLIISIPFIFLIVPRYGVIGLIISIILSQYITVFFALFFLMKMYGLGVEWLSSVKIILNSLLSALTVYAYITFTNFNDVINLIVGGTLYVLVFLIFAPIIGAVNEEDLNRFDKLITEVPIVYPLGKYIIKLEKKLLRARV